MRACSGDANCRLKAGIQEIRAAEELGRCITEPRTHGQRAKPTWDGLASDRYGLLRATYKIFTKKEFPIPSDDASDSITMPSNLASAVHA